MTHTCALYIKISPVFNYIKIQLNAFLVHMRRKVGSSDIWSDNPI